MYVCSEIQLKTSSETKITLLLLRVGLFQGTEWAAVAFSGNSFVTFDGMLCQLMGDIV